MAKPRIPDAQKARPQSRALALLERLERGGDVELVSWPGAADDDDGARFAMCALSDDELQYAYAGAWERFKELGLPVTPMNAGELHDEVNTQVLARAMRVAGADGEPTEETFFADADELRRSIKGPRRTIIRGQLTDAYLRVADSVDVEVTDELIEQVLELVKKKDVARLSGFASSTLAACLIGMADRFES